MYADNKAIRVGITAENIKEVHNSESNYGIVWALMPCCLKKASLDIPLSRLDLIRENILIW